MKKNTPFYISIVLLVSIIFTVTSCDFISSVFFERNKFMEYKDKELTRKEMNLVYHRARNSSDSLVIEKNYSRQWLKEMIYAEKGEDAANKITKKKIELKARKFKNNLLKHIYFDTEIKKNLDTTITQKDIDDYYKKYFHAYMVNNKKKIEYTLIYILFNEYTPDLEKLVKMFENPKKNNGLKKITDYAYSYGRSFSLKFKTYSFKQVNEIFPKHVIKNSFDKILLTDKKNDFSYVVPYRGVYYFIYVSKYNMKKIKSDILSNNKRQSVRKFIIQDRKKKILDSLDLLVDKKIETLLSN